MQRRQQSFGFPLKLLNKGSDLFKSSKKDNGKKRSAVELLAASKGQYVKSESVRDSTQEFKYADRVQVAKTTSDVLLQTPDKRDFVREAVRQGIQAQEKRYHGGTLPRARPKLQTSKSQSHIITNFGRGGSGRGEPLSRSPTLHNSKSLTFSHVSPSDPRPGDAAGESRQRPRPPDPRPAGHHTPEHAIASATYTAKPVGRRTPERAGERLNDAGPVTYSTPRGRRTPERAASTMHTPPGYDGGGGDGGGGQRTARWHAPPDVACRTVQSTGNLGGPPAVLPRVTGVRYTPEGSAEWSSDEDFHVRPAAESSPARKGVRPDVKRPDAARPSSARPAMTRPRLTQFDATRPDAIRPSATRPVATRPGVTQFDATRPGVTQFDATRPGVTQFDATRPDATRPVVTQFNATRPDTTRSSTTQLDTTRPDMTQFDTARPDVSRLGEVQRARSTDHYTARCESLHQRSLSRDWERDIKDDFMSKISAVLGAFYPGNGGDDDDDMDFLCDDVTAAPEITAAAACDAAGSPEKRSRRSSAHRSMPDLTLGKLRPAQRAAAAAHAGREPHDDCGAPATAAMGSTDELDISEYSHRANASLHTSDSRPDASAQNSFEEVDASPPPVTAAPPAGCADDGQPSTIKRQPVGRAKSDLQCRSSSQQQQPRPHASEAPLPVHTDPPYHRSASQQLRLAPGGDHGVAASDARHHANAQQRGDAATQPAAHSGDDVERFFNEMGIERGVLRGVMEVASRSSVFFDSVSSVDSNNAQTGMRAGGGAPRGGAGLREGGGTPRGGAGLREGDLANFGRTETSIVEKNARIIKWLINCRKACSVVVK